MSSQFKFFEDVDDSNADAREILEGLKYQPQLLTEREEDVIIAQISQLPFKEFDFHGYKGKRRVVSFGWQYEYAGGGQLHKAEEIPDFLLPLRQRAAAFAEFAPGQLEHVLVTEYGPGAGIGWHRDKAVFGQVIGISLLSPCVLRFRRKIGGQLSRGDKGTVGAKTRSSWERVNLFAQPRSAYLLSGPSRSEWQHSILRVDALRYSITFRKLVQQS